MRAAVPQADPLVGKRLAHFEILARLGAGAMGMVYKARNVNLDRVVALKLLPDSLMQQGEKYVERFLQEARAAAKLDHPNVVGVYSIGQAAGKLYIEMAFMDGGSLAGQLKQAKMNPYVAARIVRDCAAGLSAAHAQGIIHRDVKPGNILLGAVHKQGQAASFVCKLCDFGLARLQEGGKHLTQEGVAPGTPLYMSPEQAKGMPADPRSDIYSLGCVFYRMVTGKPPFEAVMALVRREEPAGAIARRHGVCEATLYRLRDEFLAAGKEALSQGRGDGRKREDRVAQMGKALAERDRVIGELTIANRILKKVQEGQL